MTQQKTTVAVSLLMIGLMSAYAAAQPPFGGRGGSDRDRGGSDRDRGGSDRDRGGSDRGGRGGPPGGGYDPTEMLRRMDTNQNGSLDPDEVSDRAKGFIARMAEGSGIDMNRPISIDRLKKVMDDRRRDRDQDSQRDQDREREAEKEKEDLTVKGFELDVELPLVPGFDIPGDSPLLATGPLEKRYDKEILERVERTLRYYDRNKDDALDKEEISRGRWSDDPKDSDLNGDGKLNKVELCERYAKKYGNEMSKKSSSSSSSRSTSSSSNSSSSYGSRGGSGYSSSRDSSSDRGSSSSGVARYAESIIRRYDQNRNGYLERDEWRGMSSSPEKHDANKDGKISRSELESGLASYGRSGSSSTASSKSSGSSKSRPSNADYRFTTTDEKLAELGVSGSSTFVRSDKNGDGQLQMAEFAYAWSTEKIDEFYDYDLNGDGVITPQEWVTVEKEK